MAQILVALPDAARSIEATREQQLTHLVRHDCGSCHGMKLEGGLGGPILPEDLNDASVEAIAAIILDGVPDKPMPAWRGLLTEDEARWIAINLKQGFPQ